MRYVVTGGEGFIGSALVASLLHDGHEVSIIEKRDDIRNPSSLDVVDSSTDGIFHLAALTSVGDSFESPDEYYDVNVTGTTNVVAAAEKYGIRIVYSSTAAVYGAAQIPIKEDAVPKPLSPYGETKLEAERAARRHTILRYFNVYGPGQRNGVIAHFVDSLSRGEPLIVYGTCTRDFVHVADVVYANRIAMDRAPPGAFNVGTGRATSIYELAGMIASLHGLDAKIVRAPARTGDIIHSVADASRMQNLGWNRRVALSDGLRRLVA